VEFALSPCRSAIPTSAKIGGPEMKYHRHRTNIVCTYTAKKRPLPPEINGLIKASDKYCAHLCRKKRPLLPALQPGIGEFFARNFWKVSYLSMQQF
jgi:hypothetical protein